MRVIPFLAVPCLLAAQAPFYTAQNALQPEWARMAPALTMGQLARRPPADRARYQLSLARIGAPGAPELLPPELARPTLGIWEQKAIEAKTPQDRFTALYFLNRLKSPKALSALEGLSAEDAKTWPKHLHLEAQIATARLNGGEVSPALQCFLDGLEKAGKVDPVRAQAARLRLVMAGKEKALLPAVEATPANTLRLLDAWNQGPWSYRSQPHLAMLNQWPEGWKNLATSLGIAASPNQASEPGCEGLLQRLLQGLPTPFPADLIADGPNEPPCISSPLVLTAFFEALGKAGEAPDQDLVKEILKETHDPNLQGLLLPALRKANHDEADKLQNELIKSPSAIARAAAIDDLPTAPVDLEALAKRCYQDTDLESALELFSALDRWKLSPEQQKAVLTPFLSHPDWGWRYQAWVQLRKTDPTAPWPSAPPERPMDKALLKEATRLAERGKPVRLRITFSGRRIVTLKLDPTVAPMNVANLVLLARKHFFDGHRVPRVVPDFVVQMGSPYDTMDGGPGYSVRCEDSLTWYGPGSVGMALAGKDTGGCQFFITTNATPHLTGKYTRMGAVENPDHDLKILDELELGAKIESVRVVD